MVRLCIIGACKIETPTETITPRADRTFALALYLILERGKPIPRHNLLSMFWPGRPEGEARHSLREAIRKLRKVGLPIPFENSQTQLRVMRDGIIVDSEQIAESSISELIAWDYSIFPGYVARVSPQFADWFDEAEAEIRALVVRQLLQKAQEAKLAADWPGVLAMAEHALTLAPDNEAAQHLAGRVRTILKSQKADDSLSTQDAVGVREQATFRSPYSSHRPSLSHVHLVGRESDLQILTQALDRVIAGSGGAIYLHGEPGIGKSRLIREFVHITKIENIAIQQTICQPHDAHRPLSVFIDLVPGLREIPGAQGCYPHTSEHLNRLTRRSSPGSDEHNTDYSYERIRQSIFDLVEAIAHEQPLIIAIENIQWSDTKSWALLRELSEWALACPVLFIFSSRTPWNQGADGPIPSFIIAHQLKPLLKAAAQQHIQEYASAVHCHIDAAFSEWCTQVAEGNPYFIEELIDYRVVTGEQFATPSSLNSIIDTRLERLEESALRVLQTCAILNRNSTFDRLRAILQYPEHEFLSAVAQLGELNMLVVGWGSTSQDFSQVLYKHDVLAARALQCLSEPGLRLLHHRAGMILEKDLNTTESSSLLWDCAQHWHAAGNITKAVELGLSCVSHLIDIGLTTEAIRTGQQTIDLCTTPEPRLKAITNHLKVLYLAKQWTGALKLFDEVAVLRKTLDLPTHQHDELELLRFDAEWYLTADWQTIIQRAERCISTTEISSLHHKVEAGTLLLKIGTNIGDAGLMHRVYHLLAPQIAQEGINDRIAQLTFELTYHAICGSLDTCRSVSHELLAFARQHFKGTRLIWHTMNCAIGFRRSGTLDLAIEINTEAFYTALREKAYSLALHAANQIIFCELDRGNINTAQDWVVKSDGLDTSTDGLGGQRIHAVASTWVALRSHDIPTAERSFSTFEQLFTNTPSVYAKALTIAAAIQLYIFQQQSAQKVSLLVEQLYPLHKKLRGMGLQDLTTYSLYLGLRYTGREEDGRTILEEYVSKFRRDPFPLMQELCNVLSSSTTACLF